MKLYSDYTPIIERQNEADFIFCSVCGRELNYTQESYSNGDETVCNDENCMEVFYEHNGDRMLIDFADEMGLKSEAMEWFYDNL